MRMVVAIVPRLFVAVVSARWNKPVQDSGQIMLQARLELNRADRCCAADVENVGRAGSNARGCHNRSNLLGDVVHVAVPFGHQGNLLLITHKVELCRSGMSVLAYSCPSIYTATDEPRRS